PSPTSSSRSTASADPDRTFVCVDRNDGEDLLPCSGLRQQLVRRARRESLHSALLISARRSDPWVGHSSGHALLRARARCHGCARFGPLGTRQLVQPLNYVSPPSDVAKPLKM